VPLYHSLNAPGYNSLDNIWGTGLLSCPFRPHHHGVLRGGGGPSFPGPAILSKSHRPALGEAHMSPWIGFLGTRFPLPSLTMPMAEPCPLDASEEL